MSEGEVATTVANGELALHTPVVPMCTLSTAMPPMLLTGKTKRPVTFGMFALVSKQL